MRKAILLMFMVLSMLPFSYAKASAPAPAAVAVATVNIQNATIVSQKDHQITVGFDLTNREGAQPGVKYSVILAQQKETGQVTIDSRVYPETISLGENDLKHVTAVYDAPGFVSGDYFVVIEARNEAGLPLGISPAGKVSLKALGETLDILSESCYLTVGNAQQKYTLTQGVDVLPEEDLVAHCDIKSTFSKAVTVVPNFVNHLRNSFGDMVSDVNVDKVDFAAGKTVTKEFVLPKAKDPQAYDAVLTMTDEQGKQVSNSVIFHYVIHGGSATIQNLVFDKDSYNKGDTATLSFFWSGAADAFPNSRLGKTDVGVLSIEAKMTSKEGTSCANPYTGTLDRIKGPQSTIQFAVASSCLNPKVDLTVKDKDGKVLAKNTFSVTSGKSALVKNQEAKSSSRKLWPSIFALVAAAGVIGAAVWFLVKKRKNGKAVPPALMFLLALCGGFLFFSTTQTAKADTFYGTIDVAGDGSDVITVTYTANINKNVFIPGEQLAASGTFQSSICSNGSTFTSGELGSVMTVTVNGTTQTLFSNGGDSGTAYFNVENTPGNYNAVFYTDSNFRGGAHGYASYPIPYSVGGYDAQPVDTFPTSFNSGETKHVTLTFNNIGQAPWVADVRGAADPNSKSGTCDVDSDGDGINDSPASTDANDNASCTVRYLYSSSSFKLQNTGSFSQTPNPIPVYTPVAVTRTWHMGDPDVQICTRIRVCDDGGSGLLQQDSVNYNFDPLIPKAHAMPAGGQTCYYQLDCTPAPQPGYYSTSTSQNSVVSGESTTFTFDITAPTVNSPQSFTETWQMTRSGTPFGSPLVKTINIGGDAATGTVTINSKDTSGSLVASTWTLSNSLGFSSTDTGTSKAYSNMQATTYTVSPALTPPAGYTLKNITKSSDLAKASLKDRVKSFLIKVAKAVSVSPSSSQNLTAGSTIAFDIIWTAIPATPALGQPSGITINNPGVCPPRLDLSWTAGANATSYDIFRTADGSIDPNTTNPAPTIPNVAGLSYQDSAITAATPYYYWVRSNGNGGPSAWVEADNAPVAATVCAPNLSINSNKDILSANGLSLIPGNTPPNDSHVCQGQSNTLGANSILKLGDVVVFSVNLCNSGNAGATGVQLTDNMISLLPFTGDGSHASDWDIKYDAGSGVKSGLPANVSFTGSANVATATSRLVFSGSGLNIPASNSINDKFLRIIVSARLAVPANFNNSIGRFQNTMNVNYSSGSPFTKGTALLPFDASSGAPIRTEQ